MMTPPINAPLGNDFRACLVLALLALAPCLYSGRGEDKRECALLCGGILLLALNPWCADFVAGRTHAVMTWRWFWIAPLPVVAAMLFAVFWGGTRQSARPARGIAAGLVLTLVFLCSGAWTCRPGNMDFHFAWPQWKTPNEYAELLEVLPLLPPVNEGVTVLAPGPQSVWLPVMRPGIGLVALGHTQAGALKKLAPSEEYDWRRGLQFLVENDVGKLMTGKTERILLRRLGVTHIIAANDKLADMKLPGIADRRKWIRLVGKTNRFSVLALSPK